ncbi:unnamed protein product [Macrosiphum euphorbiae]|uniref:Uncharacterized protein n=1 Tax=Macrosiphum euphorbiae TaxID=13131 RepID=A0AAV0VUB8_9HEMI|nr:unnamed protein product [Macrosiphum euphorbiae]
MQIAGCQSLSPGGVGQMHTQICRRVNVSRMSHKETHVMRWNNIKIIEASRGFVRGFFLVELFFGVPSSSIGILPRDKLKAKSERD